MTVEAARATGLPAGIPVVAGLGDGQAACLGAGVTSLDRAYLNLGTAVTGGPVGRRYVTDPSCRTLYGGSPGTFLFENVLRGGLATMTWFMRHFGDSFQERADFGRYEAAARELGPGSGGLLLVPYWNGVTSPYWDPFASGIVVGWHHGHRREHLFRAIEEGIAYEHRLAAEGIQGATGERIGEHVILGGGSNSDLWCQIMADVLGAPVTRAHTAEATNLGAGILCAFGIGWYPSVEEAAAAMTGVAESFQPEDPARERYDRLFTEVYRPLLPAVQERLQRLWRLRAEFEEGRDWVMTTVAILGSGVMASALTTPLADNGHDVRLVGTHLDRDIIDSLQATGVHPGLSRRLPESVRPYQVDQVEAAFDGAEIVMSGVNSLGVRWAGQRIAPLLRPGMLVIAIAKGMAAGEDGDLRILPDVLAEQVPAELRRRVGWAAIGGPSIAGEVAARRDTCVVFTGHEQAALDRLAATFRTGWYHVWTSTDLVGVEVSAALKNCYALGVGFAEGVLDRLGEGDGRDRNHNYEAALFAQAVGEIAQMVELLGGRPETPFGLAGVGDLFVTSTGGRNIRVGRLLGSGLRMSEARARMGDITLEGAAAIQVIGGALPKLADRGVIGAEDFPLLRQLHAVVGHEQPPEVPWSVFFGGEAGAVAAARETAG